MLTPQLKERLYGTWHLEQFIDVIDNEKIVHTMGESAKGYISYNHDGWMSVQIMSADRELYGNPDITGGSPEQLIKAATSYFAYAGPFITDDNEKTVTHCLEHSFIPNWVGTEQKRFVQLEDDDSLLILKSEPMIFDGVTHQPELRWRRR